jgi:hypothetical protein
MTDASGIFIAMAIYLGLKAIADAIKALKKTDDS